MIGEVIGNLALWQRRQGAMGVLKDFRRAADALERLAAGQTHFVRAQEDTRIGETRLRELEKLVTDLDLERGRWEADVEATLLKAEGKLQAANNAEARTRTMKKAYEKFVDPFDPEGEEIEAAVLPDDAERGEEEGVPALRLDVAENNKAQALRAKWL